MIIFSCGHAIEHISHEGRHVACDGDDPKGGRAYHQNDARECERYTKIANYIWDVDKHISRRCLIFHDDETLECCTALLARRWQLSREVTVGHGAMVMVQVPGCGYEKGSNLPKRNK